MSWSAAHDRLVAIIDGTTPLMKKKGLSAKFKYFDEASREELPTESRGWFLEIEKIAMKGQNTYGLPRWQRATLHALTFYPKMIARSVFLEAIAGDHLALVTRLGDQSLWNQPTSTIESLFLGSELLGETQKIDVEGGSLLDTMFEMEWNNV